MPRISRDSLMTLEAYAKARNEFRANVMAHKKHRTIPLGENITLLFEDELTIRYQVQEMLRVEKIFEEAGIQEEIEAYDALIPDGSNFKATMMIEYPDVEERKRMLARFKGVEDRVWVQVAGFPKAHAVADEDVDRAQRRKNIGGAFRALRIHPRDGKGAEDRSRARGRRRPPELQGAGRRGARRNA